jgi:hydrogenase small subunit
VAGIDALDILWITAGLGCDGDTIAMTAASLPSIEDVLGGVIPNLPAVRLYNPVLAYEVGDEFLAVLRAAAEDRHARPFLLVIEGSIPDERLSGTGVWAGLGTDPSTGQPIPTCDWIDRLAPRAWAVLAAGTCATYGGIHCTTIWARGFAAGAACRS